MAKQEATAAKIAEKAAKKAAKEAEIKVRKEAAHQRKLERQQARHNREMELAMRGVGSNSKNAGARGVEEFRKQIAKLRDQSEDLKQQVDQSQLDIVQHKKEKALLSKQLEAQKGIVESLRQALGVQMVSEGVRLQDAITTYEKTQLYCTTRLIYSADPIPPGFAVTFSKNVSQVTSHQDATERNRYRNKLHLTPQTVQNTN